MVPAILDKLNLQSVLIDRPGPYFQGQTSRHAAVQIDYLIQASNSLYVCETKFRESIGVSVAEDVQEKIWRLARARAKKKLGSRDEYGGGDGLLGRIGVHFL